MVVVVVVVVVVGAEVGAECLAEEKKDWKKLRTFFFTSRKPLKLFRVYQNGNFHWEKAKITLGKNQEK